MNTNLEIVKQAWMDRYGFSLNFGERIGGFGARVRKLGFLEDLIEFKSSPYLNLDEIWLFWMFESMAGL